MSPEQKNEWNDKNEEDNNIGQAYNERLNRVVESSSVKRISLLWAYGKHLKIMR